MYVSDGNCVKRKLCRWETISVLDFPHESRVGATVGIVTVMGQPTDSVASDGQPCAEHPVVEMLPSNLTDVGGIPVRRALPRRTRRLVGAWCFVDHFGPAAADAMQIGPHPHIGLQTVTWLLDGEVVHHDSLGSEQLIRPGQLNLMTAGAGIAHAEEATGNAARMHGAQLWLALPDRTRHDDPAFEHHGELPQAAAGTFDVTVLVGEMLGAASTARADTPVLGADLSGRPGTSELPLRRNFEHAVVVLEGRLTVCGTVVEPGSLAYLGTERDELPISCDEPTRALLLGGEPLGENVMMWWNFVGRSRDEFDAAREQWNAGSDRFGEVTSARARIPAPLV